MGLFLSRVHGAYVEGNTIVSTQVAGIRVQGQRNRILNNFISQVSDSYSASNEAGMSLTWQMRWQSGRMKCFGLHNMGREGIVMGVEMTLGKRRDLLAAPAEALAEFLTLDSPVLNGAELGEIRGLRNTATASTLYPIAAGPDGLKAAVKALGQIDKEVLATHAAAIVAKFQNSAYGVRYHAVAVQTLGKLDKEVLTALQLSATAREQLGLDK